MKKNTRFSDVLHMLLHIASSGKPVTSESLAQSAQTNPVVVRRVMAGLRNQGYVQSEKGHGGGWTLSCELNKVTLFDVYKAIGSPTMFAFGNRSESSECLIEHAVITSIEEVLDDTEALLEKKFQHITLAKLQNIVKK